MGRAPCCDKSKVKRGPWSPDEDTTLKNYINNHGTGGNWIALPHKAGLKRCGKSCRLRWLNYLRPDIKHGGFTVEEDNIILRLYHNIGSRWSIIASHLPGRTDNDIKNYWNTKLKKKVLRETRSSPTTTTIATAATTSTTTVDATNNADNNFNHATPSTLTETMETNYVGSPNSNNMLPYYPMQDSTQFPFPRLVEVPENGINSYSGFPTIPLSPKLPSFSPSFSLDNIGLISTTCSINGGGEDYNFFDEFNYRLAYDILFDLDVQENMSEFNPSITTSSDNSFAG